MRKTFKKIESSSKQLRWISFNIQAIESRELCTAFEDEKENFLFIFYVLKGKKSKAVLSVGFSTGRNEITQENVEKFPQTFSHEFSKFPIKQFSKSISSDSRMKFIFDCKLNSENSEKLPSSRLTINFHLVLFCR